MTYEALAGFAQKGGTIYFALIFALVCIYAFWPKNKKKFNDAASVPLDDKDDDRPL